MFNKRLVYSPLFATNVRIEIVQEIVVYIIVAVSSGAGMMPSCTCSTTSSGVLGSVFKDGCIFFIQNY